MFESVVSRSGRIVVALLKDIRLQDIDALGFAADLFRGSILAFAGPEHAMLGQCLGDEGGIEPGTDLELPDLGENEPFALLAMILSPACPVAHRPIDPFTQQLIKPALSMQRHKEPNLIDRLAYFACFRATAQCDPLIKGP